jgi:hypothetical protein
MNGTELKIGKGMYKVNPSLVVMEDGVPVLNYREGIVDPIDMLHTDQEQNVLDSNQLSDIVIRSYSLGKRSVPHQQDMYMLLAMASTGASLAAAGLSWKILTLMH